MIFRHPSPLARKLASVGIVAAMFGAPAMAAPAGDPGGMLRTLPRGTFECALPGNAAGDAYRVVSEESFRIGTASRYRSEEGTGTYILRGQFLTFTSGPKKDERFRRIGPNQVRKLGSDGETTDLLCTRRGSR